MGLALRTTDTAGAPRSPIYEGPIKLEKLREVSFLKHVAPRLHVEDGAFMAAFRPLPMAAEDVEAAVQRVTVEGYTDIAPAERGLDMEAMAGLVRTLARNDLPTPLAFLYDEFWLLFYSADPILTEILGPGYFRMPDFWAWHVDPQKSQSGWKPHRDKGKVSLFEDGRPMSMTIWIPLTDATTLNGCMYLVPKDRDPQYGFAPPDAPLFAIQDVRALPGAAGTIFMWDQCVMHWGSHASPRAIEPRVSIALEFQTAAIKPMNSPLTKPGEVPPLKQRMKLIAKQILQYAHMYPLRPEIARWAKSI